MENTFKQGPNVPVISKVSDPSATEQQCVAQLDFSCCVTMHDSGTQLVGGNLPFTSPKPLPHQWFKLQMSLTNELLRNGTAEQIGNAVKSAVAKLDADIKAYEKG